MKQRKHRVLLAFVLSVSLMFCGCAKEDVTFEPEPSEFFKMVRDGEIEDLSLTIYFVRPWAESFANVSIDELIAWSSTEDAAKYGFGGIIVIEGTELTKYTDLLISLSTEKLIPIELDCYLNARIYYVFRDKDERTVFEVAMWAFVRGEGNAIFVNGVYVKEKGIYYDIIIPFIPDERIVGRLEEMKPTSGKRP